MQVITMHIPKPYLRDIERLVNEGHYPNRSELIRVAVRDLIKEEFYKEKFREVRKLKTDLGLVC